MKIDRYVLSKCEHRKFHKISDVAELFLGKLLYCRLLPFRFDGCVLTSHLKLSSYTTV